MFVDNLQAEIDDAVRRVRAGERDAFRVLIEVCETRLRLTVAPLLPDQSSVEDVVQQAFVTAYRKLDQYQLGTGFISWMATIARYEALNERRRWINERSFKRRYQDEVRIEKHMPEEIQGQEQWMDDQAGTIARLHQCISNLRERSADVVRAHYFDLLPNEEIAAQHGRNPAWVRLVLHRARQAIAECLKSSAEVTL